jgi:hypothetical protein
MSTQVKEEDMGRIMLATSNSTDEEYGGTFATEATDVAYDNTQSGLTADDVQEAIDEVCDRDKWIYAGEITTSTTASFPPVVTKEWLFVCYSSDGNSILGSLHIECNGGIGVAYRIGSVVLGRAGTTISMTTTTNDRVKFFYKIY